MEKLNTIFEEIKVLGHDLTDKVRELIREGNVHRIIIKDEHGRTFVEIPVTVAAVGAVFAPVLAAVGTIAAMAAKFTIVVERSAPMETPAAPVEQTTRV
ncbi:MAG TPA: DUF4342 domain-containing protein [Bryobacteraceae bacterium]|nr:DUF4342 domain-containing protein [Bryobacteraceae bacterium]